MIETIEAKSNEENFRRSRLPSFTQEEIDLIKGTSDFLGLNYYNSYYCSADFDNSAVTVPSMTNDIGANCRGVAVSTESWGLRKLLKYIKTEYNNPKILITENGYGVNSAADSLDDCDRTNYFNVSIMNYLQDKITCNIHLVVSSHASKFNLRRWGQCYWLYCVVSHG